MNIIFNRALKGILLGFLFLSPMIALSKDFGTMGEIYPIIEMDFFDFIQSKFDSLKQNGTWKIIENKAKEHAKTYRNRPPRVEGLTRATENTSRIFDPTVTLDRDLKTSDGKLVAVKGTKVNPLQYMPLSKTLIFFDGDDGEQVKWVMKENKKLNDKTKLILVNGSLLEIEKVFKKQIYFDQRGAFTKRFQIKNIPTLIQQEKDHLIIKVHHIV